MNNLELIDSQLDTEKTNRIGKFVGMQHAYANKEFDPDTVIEELQKIYKLELLSNQKGLYILTDKQGNIVKIQYQKD